MTATPARAAAFATLRTIHAGELADRAFVRHVADVDARERPWLRELVFGTLRLRGRLDHAIAHFARRPIDRIDDDVLDVLRLGLYQLRWMGAVPGYAAVSESVDLARAARGARAGGFVNGVLRAATRAPDEPAFPEFEADPVSHLATWGSHPRWLVERWVERFGATDARRLVEADNRVPELYLRPVGQPIEAALAILRTEGIAAGAVPSSPGSIRLEHSRDVVRALEVLAAVVQDPAAGLVADFVGPAGGGVVLDACASPGGKALGLAAGTGADRVRYVVAADVSSERTARLAGNVARVEAWTGPLPLAVLIADARRPAIRRADVVLLDVPCTGTGTLRRHPDGRWRIRPSDLAALVTLQRTILDGEAGVVPPGGLLVYATCSLEPEENEDQMDAFLRRHPDFELEPGASPAGMTDVRGFLRVLPQDHGFDGSFAARLRRRRDAR